MKRIRGLHPSKDIIGSLGNELEGKQIILCVTGSVAAYKSIDFARLLMRHGANVIPVISESATLLINPNFLKWATGNTVIDKLTANMEHIALGDFNMSDLIVVYPCTANTLSKFACGIDDTPITSILTVSLGSKIPIFIAPAMHESIYQNEFVLSNLDKLKKIGISIIEPSIIEGKAKIATPEKALSDILGFFSNTSKKILLNKKILITSGSTMEYIDPVRVISNLSSGKMGQAIVNEALELGAQVVQICGNSISKQIHSNNFRFIQVSTSDEMYNMVVSELSSGQYDIAIMAAAVTDFKLNKVKKKKMNSRNVQSLRLDLIPTKKIINDIKIIDKNIFLVGFTAYHDVSDSFLISKANEKLKESNSDIIVANDIGRKNSKIGSDFNEVFIISSNKPVIHLELSRKEIIAKQLLKLISSYVNN
ncbi:MAG: bifunctional phosphopantothenoylcysteine decarboxylase/phosphopantothenate--cysteine ligase CoaBC [Nitrososphaeraceae archaeon]|nr:bifunctional phosphopantothenoylcysteine decarboxylase/phosphopantothenate--cysteine ligase CoaBC [Nitrososphaeraceae archaeon]